MVQKSGSTVAGRAGGDRGTDGAGPPRKPGRPRAFDRSAALDKATRVFWTKGYEATSMTDLTRAMGIRSPSLYAAFGSKEALYAEALEHYRATWDAVVWGRFDASGTAREAARLLLLDAAAALAGDVEDIPRGCMMSLSIVDSAEHARIGHLVRTGRARILSRLRVRIERAIMDEEAPATTDAAALARFLQAVLTGMSILAHDGATGDEPRSVAEAAMGGWDLRVGAPEPSGP